MSEQAPGLGGQTSSAAPMLGGIGSLRETALHGENPLYRRRAIKLLAQQSDPANLETFLQVLSHDDDLTARKWAEGGLYRLPTEHLPHMLTILCEPGHPPEMLRGLMRVLHMRIAEARELIEAWYARMEHGPARARLAYLLYQAESSLGIEAYITLIREADTAAMPAWWSMVRRPPRDPRVVEALIAELLNPFDDVWRYHVIVFALGSMAEQASEALRPLLQDPLRQMHLTRALWRWADPPTIRWALETLMSPDREAATEVAAMIAAERGTHPLYEMDFRFEPALLRLLQDSAWEMRAAGAWLVGALRADEAVPTLITAMDDPVRDVVERAAVSLRLIGNEAAMGALRQRARGGQQAARDALTDD